MSVNGGLPYTNEGYDAQKNQQTLGYSANGIEGGGSAEFKYPHLQLRDVSCDVRSEGCSPKMLGFGNMTCLVFFP